jgi:peptide/nickel transport system permease protein
MTAMNFGSLIAFALITETVFQWPGMGMLFIQAVTFLAMPVMAGYLCIVSFIFVTLNTLVDIAYAVIDPRLRDATR